MLCSTACIALALLAADTTPVPGAPAVTGAPVVPATSIAVPESRPPALPITLVPRAQALPPALDPGLALDTVPEHHAVELSDAYYTRLRIHKLASYATVPLFVAQYVAGEQLMDKGDDAPGWARDLHPALAAGVGGLFVVNTVTGGWNLWEARNEPQGRTRRLVHGGLMLLADAGFAATGLLAEKAGDDGDARDLHRDVALGSMGVSLLSYAIMLPLFGNR